MEVRRKLPLVLLASFCVVQRDLKRQPPSQKMLCSILLALLIKTQMVRLQALHSDSHTEQAELSAS